MPASLNKVFGYQGNNMALPVEDVSDALHFYETVLGFRATETSDGPPRSAVLARDQVQIGLVENGGDPTQDGCAFHVSGLDELFEEFRANGLTKLSVIDTEHRDGADWRVFFVVAPDGLCYWFGERQPA